MLNKIILQETLNRSFDNQNLINFVVDILKN